MSQIARIPTFLLVFSLLLIPCVKGLCTSAQIEETEPVLTLADKAVHGTASFGALLGGHVFDSAGNLGATFPLGHIKKSRIYFLGDLYTYVKNPGGQRFQPRRIIYTLEPGYYWEHRDAGYRFFIKHQSFHLIDQPAIGPESESYELYGLSYRQLSSPHLYASVGKYLNKRVVDYNWDFAASATWDLQPWGRTEPYLHGWLHHVTESDHPTGRSGFTDYAAEFGVRFSTGMIPFARYEFLNDIDRFAGSSDHHTLLGLRYTW